MKNSKGEAITMLCGASIAFIIMASISLKASWHVWYVLNADASGAGLNGEAGAGVEIVRLIFILLTAVFTTRWKDLNIWFLVALFIATCFTISNIADFKQSVNDDKVVELRNSNQEYQSALIKRDGLLQDLAMHRQLMKTAIDKNFSGYRKGVKKEYASDIKETQLRLDEANRILQGITAISNDSIDGNTNDTIFGYLPNYLKYLAYGAFIELLLVLSLIKMGNSINQLFYTAQTGQDKGLEEYSEELPEELQEEISEEHSEEISAEPQKSNKKQKTSRKVYFQKSKKERDFNERVKWVLNSDLEYPFKNSLVMELCGVGFGKANLIIAEAVKIKSEKIADKVTPIR